jgi:hypothetical protein
MTASAAIVSSKPIKKVGCRELKRLLPPPVNAMCDRSYIFDASDLARLAYPIGIAQHILAHFSDGRHR